MPKKHSNLLNALFTIAAKDIRLEFRSPVALSTILLFGLSTVAIISFSVAGIELSPVLIAALYWIVIFFSAVTALAHSLVKEEESGTLLALKISVEGAPVYLGKLLVNFLILTLLLLLITPMFFLFLDMPVENIGLFLLIALLGDIALCTGTTIVAAIIARAASRGALFAVLSFPVLIPLLLVLVHATGKLLSGGDWGDIASALQFLLSYSVVMGSGSVLLFRFVWDE